MPTFAVFVVKSVGLHNYFLPFQCDPVVAESCLRKTRDGCTAIGTAVNKLSWKAGALTIVLHLRLPSVEIVSLDILTYIGMHVKQFSYNFLQFFHKLSGFFHFPLPATPIQKPIEQNSAILHTVSGKFFSHPLWMPLDRPDR